MSIKESTGRHVSKLIFDAILCADKFYRTAQKQEIVKAYRKLAAQWHPDQYNGNDKNHAEKMFIDIAAAKEVLTDPGLLLPRSVTFK